MRMARQDAPYELRTSPRVRIDRTPSARHPVPMPRKGAKVAKSANGLREIDAFFRKSGKVIVALTVREILDEQLAKKLA